MDQTNAITASDLEQFILFLEGKIGHINRRDQETVECLKNIMSTKLHVFGDLYVE